jgi:hypothetical protein
MGMKRGIRMPHRLRRVPARLVGVAERAVLGAAMSVALAVLERRLSPPSSRAKNKADC